MQKITKIIKHPLIYIVLSILFSALNPAAAESDREMQDKLLRQREALQHGQHANPASTLSNGPDFRVFIMAITLAKKRIVAALKKRCP